MKVFYMILLLIFQIILTKINIKCVDNQLKNINLLLIGEIAIAICIIGALG